MRLLRKYWLVSAIVIVISMSLGSCVQYGAVFDDDEWMGGDYNSENLLLNGELEIDDYDR